MTDGKGGREKAGAMPGLLGKVNGCRLPHCDSALSPLQSFMLGITSCAIHIMWGMGIHWFGTHWFFFLNPLWVLGWSHVANQYVKCKLVSAMLKPVQIGTGWWIVWWEGIPGRGMAVWDVNWDQEGESPKQYRLNPNPYSRLIGLTPTPTEF